MALKFLMAVLFLTTLLPIEKVSALHIVETKTAFSLNVPSPALLVECQDRLWVYSKEKRAFSVFAPADGRKVFEFPLSGIEKYDQVSAGACSRGDLVLAVVIDKKTNKYLLGRFEITGDVKLALKKRIPLPSPGRITDLVCNKNQCWMIVDGKVFFTSGLERWESLAIPPARTIKHTKIDTSTNPFDDWQEKLLTAEGRYTRLLTVGPQQLLLLDPFRANVVVQSKEGFVRWGKWGVWEGSFMTPKAFAQISKDSLLIADPSLKALMIFSFDGDYRGALGSSGRAFAPEYASQILQTTKHTFVADLLNNEVLALDIKVPTESPKPSSKDPSDGEYLRGNFFRRPEVLEDRIKNRCLLCHDGTVSDESEKYFKNLVNHPVNVVQKTHTDIPLTEGNQVTCASCHDPHHGAGKEGAMKKAPFLRKETKQLCASCHDKVLEPHKQCTQCHQVHGGIGRILKGPDETLCLSCHKERRFKHRAVEPVEGTMRSQDIALSGDQIKCLTCHEPHGKAQKEVRIFCASCHGEKATALYQNFHKRVKK